MTAEPVSSLPVNMEEKLFSGVGPLEDSAVNCSGPCYCSSEELLNSSVAIGIFWSISSPVRRYAPYVAAVEALLFAVSFCWNLIIIANFVRRRKILKDAACVYLLNVAIVNFLFSTFVIFQCVLTESAGHFFIGNTNLHRCRICDFLGFMVMFLMTNMLHTLATLSFDRFFLFIKPMKYNKYFTWKSALLVVSCIWILCFCLSVMPYFGLGRYSFNTVIANCHPMWTGVSRSGVSNITYIAILAIESLIPILVLTVTNIWAIRIIWRSIRQRHQRWIANGSSSPKELKEISIKVKSESCKKQWQVVKVFGALFIAHICCWTPVLLTVVVAGVLSASAIPSEVFVVCWILFLFNPVAHPVIESYFIKDLRMSLITVEQQLKRSFSNRSHFNTIRRTTWKKKRSISFIDPKTSRRLQKYQNVRMKLRPSHSFMEPTKFTSSTIKSSELDLTEISEHQLVLPIASKEVASLHHYEVSITLELPCASVYKKINNHPHKKLSSKSVSFESHE